MTTRPRIESALESAISQFAQLDEAPDEQLAHVLRESEALNARIEQWAVLCADMPPVLVAGMLRSAMYMGYQAGRATRDAEILETS